MYRFYLLLIISSDASWYVCSYAVRFAICYHTYLPLDFIYVASIFGCVFFRPWQRIDLALALYFDLRNIHPKSLTITATKTIQSYYSLCSVLFCCRCCIPLGNLYSLLYIYFTLWSHFLSVFHTLSLSFSAARFFSKWKWIIEFLYPLLFLNSYQYHK